MIDLANYPNIDRLNHIPVEQAYDLIFDRVNGSRYNEHPQVLAVMMRILEPERAYELLDILYHSQCTHRTYDSIILRISELTGFVPVGAIEILDSMIHDKIMELEQRIIPSKQVNKQFLVNMTRHGRFKNMWPWEAAKEFKRINTDISTDLLNQLSANADHD